jgi:kinetochore protein Spc7/SPC105
MRARLLCLPQHLTPIKRVFKFITSTWELATRISAELRTLNLTYLTTPAITSDSSLAITVQVLLREMRTRVTVSYSVDVGGDGLEVQEEVGVSAKVVYGEELKEGKMGEFLASKVGEGRGLGWVKGVRELEERLIKRGRREQERSE